MKKTDSVVVYAGLRVKPEFCEEFIARAGEVVKQTRREKGCVEYTLTRDVARPDTFFFFEEYADADAFAAHREMPYMNPFREFRAKVVAEYLGVSTFVRTGDR